MAGGPYRLDGPIVRMWMARRRKRNMDLARACGVSESFISNALRERVGCSRETVEAIAGELAVTPDHLLPGTAALRVAAVAS